jgi:putative FmdB family regulatory protein
MPTYEYKCTRCGEVTSEFKPMSAPRRQRCPVCRCKVDLLITGGLGIVFKGEGFYVNDSRAAARSASRPVGGATGADKSGSDKSGGEHTGSATPSESKPGGAGSDTGPKPGGTGEKPVASGDGTVHDRKSTARDKD